MGEDFVKVVKVAETKDIQASQMMAVEVYGEKVCLSNVKGNTLHAGIQSRRVRINFHSNLTMFKAARIVIQILKNKSIGLFC
jgi:hypothetical protein